MAAEHLLSLTARKGETPDPARHLTARFGWSRSQIMRMVAAGQFPRPMNYEQRSHFLWHRDVVESYEIGTWRPSPMVRPPATGTPPEPVRLPRSRGAA